MSKFLITQFWDLFIKEDKVKRSFIFLSLLASFCISMDYAIVRPVCNSYFITCFGSELLPYAWLVAIPLNFALVMLYNFLLPRWGSRKVFLSTILLVGGLNLLSATLLTSFPKISFALYVWKEIYVLILFQQLWSEIHAFVDETLAKKLYGIMFGVGALGAISGSLIPGFFAVDLGSSYMLFACLPIYVALACITTYLTSYNLQAPRYEKKEQITHPLTGVKMILGSSSLLIILSLVILMQMCSTLFDYQFNHFLAQIGGGLDLKTEVCARTVSWIHITTLLLQFVGSYFIIHVLGRHKAHFIIPLLLLINSSSLLAFPSLTIASLGYITIKALDFSLFGVLKEMLYIPLKRDEKYRAKSFIDVFAYRGSKALASCFILAFQALGVFASQAMTWLSVMNIFLCLMWFIVIFVLIKRNKASPIVN